jgi:hypothetical protein
MSLSSTRTTDNGSATKGSMSAIPYSLVQRDSTGASAFSQLTLSADPTTALQTATKQYVDAVNTNVTAVRTALHSVKDFGAVGDGVSDDTVAITALCNTINSAGGGIIYFPTGTYKLTNYVLVYPNMTFRGDGPSSKITSSTAMVLRASGSSIWSNITIQKLNLVTTNAASVYDGIIDFNGQSVSNVLIEDVTLTSTAGEINTIHFNGLAGNKVNNLRINRCIMPACTRIAIEIFGYDQVGSSNIKVSNCTILNPVMMGVSFSGGCRGIICKDNYILGNNTSNGIEVAGPNMSDITIEGNKLAGSFGAIFGMNNTAPTVPNNVLINANTSVGTVTGNFHLWNFLGGYFTNNVFNMTGNLDIENSGANNCRIFGNRLTTAFTTVVFVANATGVVICDNVLDNSACAACYGVIQPYNCLVRAYRNQMFKGGGGGYINPTVGGTYTSYQNQFGAAEESFGSSNVTASSLTTTGALSSGAATVASLSLPTTGGTATPLAYYEEYNYTTTFVCGTYTTPELRLQITRVGRQVSLIVLDLYNSNSGTPGTSFDATIKLPARFCPNNLASNAVTVTNNGSLVMGTFAIHANGSVLIWAGFRTQGFTGTGGIGFDPPNVSYSI